MREEVEELTKVLSDLVRENRELEVRSVMVIRVIEFQAVGAKLEIFLGRSPRYIVTTE